MTKLLLIDNFDSFTYNLHQALSATGVDVTVVRNDELAVNRCLDLNPNVIVVGPGPGQPAEAGISKTLIAAAAGSIPVLGICLGHQAINEVYGGRTVRAKRPMHGKTSAVTHDGQGVFLNIPQHCTVMRYHSLLVDRFSMPACLKVTAETSDGEVMGLRHRTLPIESVQFHPESIVGALDGAVGHQIIRNFIDNHLTARIA